MQQEVNEFMGYVKQELAKGIGDWEQRLSTALVKSSPADLIRADQAPNVSTRAINQPKPSKSRNSQVK